MLLALVAVVAVGGLATLIFFTVLALTSARSLGGVVAAARADLMPAVEEVVATAKEIAARAQRLRPSP